MFEISFYTKHWRDFNLLKDLKDSHLQQTEIGRFKFRTYQKLMENEQIKTVF